MNTADHVCLADHKHHKHQYQGLQQTIWGFHSYRFSRHGIIWCQNGWKVEIGWDGLFMQSFPEFVRNKYHQLQHSCSQNKLFKQRALTSPRSPYNVHFWKKREQSSKLLLVNSGGDSNIMRSSPSCKGYLVVVPPSDVCWFINHGNYSYRYHKL